jgi:hypothetical protein
MVAITGWRRTVLINLAVYDQSANIRHQKRATARNGRFSSLAICALSQPHSAPKAWLTLAGPCPVWDRERPATRPTPSARRLLLVHAGDGSGMRLRRADSGGRNKLAGVIRVKKEPGKGAKNDPLLGRVTKPGLSLPQNRAQALWASRPPDLPGLRCARHHEVFRFRSGLKTAVCSGTEPAVLVDRPPGTLL